jgi:HlyD family secretion protein
VSSFGRCGWQTFAILAGLVVAGCSRAPEELKVVDDVARAERRSIVDVRREDGRLQACRIFNFIPAVGSLKLQSLNVKEGDSVTEGQQLYAFRTDTVREQIAILELQTNAIAHKIEMETFRAEVEIPMQTRMALIDAQTVHKDAVRAAETRAQMSQGGLAAEAKLATALRAKERAGLSLQLATQNNDRAVSGAPSIAVADLEVELKRCERDLGATKERLANCYGEAPFSGRVVSVNHMIRDYGYDFGEKGVKFTSSRGPLVIIADTGKMRIVTSFFESAVAYIKTGQRAEVVADHAPGRVFKGEVISISQLGFAYGQSSTVSVEVMVDNEEGLLRAGLTAAVSIIVARNDEALAIPSRFLRGSGSGCYVWRQEDSRPVRTPVETGIADRQFVEILAGLEVGDEVVME